MNKIKTLTALFALASSTAFAAGSGIQDTLPALPVAQALLVAQARPVAPTPVTPATPDGAPAVGQPGQVCAPHPMKDQARPPRPGAAALAVLGNTAPAPGTPAAMKDAPVRPGADGRTTNCGPLAGRPEQRGREGSGNDRPDNNRPGAQQPGQVAPHGQQGQSQRGHNQQSQRPGQAPGTRMTDAARLQNELTRIDALLARTTDARARGYLNDARIQAQNGNVRAAQALIRAAEAINTPK